jgi:hypothetical protein
MDRMMIRTAARTMWSSRLLPVLCAALLYFFTGCTSERTDDPMCPVYLWPSIHRIIPPPDVEVVPETLFVEGRTYTIECLLWRDFMPISPPGGKHMIAHVKVLTIDSPEIPSDLDATYIWVFNKNEVWGSYFTDERSTQEKPYERIRIARCGPKWETDIFVDVVVKVIIGHKYFYLKEEAVYIFRTE